MLSIIQTTPDESYRLVQVAVIALYSIGTVAAVIVMYVQKRRKNVNPYKKRDKSLKVDKK